MAIGWNAREVEGGGVVVDVVRTDEAGQVVGELVLTPAANAGPELAYRAGALGEDEAWAALVAAANGQTEEMPAEEAVRENTPEPSEQASEAAGEDHAEAAGG